MWTTAPCIHGQSIEKSQLYLSTSFVGNAIWTNNSWLADNQFSTNDGTIIPSSMIKYGIDLADFIISGDRFAPGRQQGIIMQGATNYANIRRIFVRSLNGTCFGGGLRDVNVPDGNSYFLFEESVVNDVRLHHCGSGTAFPAMYIGPSTNLYMTAINIWASYGTGLQITADGASSTSIK